MSFYLLCNFSESCETSDKNSVAAVCTIVQLRKLSTIRHASAISANCMRRWALLWLSPLQKSRPVASSFIHFHSFFPLGRVAGGSSPTGGLKYLAVFQWLVSQKNIYFGIILRKRVLFFATYRLPSDMTFGLTWHWPTLFNGIYKKLFPLDLRFSSWNAFFITHNALHSNNLRARIHNNARFAEAVDNQSGLEKKLVIVP